MFRNIWILFLDRNELCYFLLLSLFCFNKSLEIIHICCYLVSFCKKSENLEPGVQELLRLHSTAPEKNNTGSGRNLVITKISSYWKRASYRSAAILNCLHHSEDTTAGSECLPHNPHSCVPKRRKAIGSNSLLKAPSLPKVQVHNEYAKVKVEHKGE